MRPLFSSSRSPQRPAAAETKDSPDRHAHVISVADTTTMGTTAEHLELLVELVTKRRPGTSPRTRVLVFGDQADVAELVRKLFREHWEIFIAGSNADAIERVTTVRPDVVLLDTRGLGFNGWEICRRLKEDSETRAIPVIAVAGRLEEGDRVLGPEFGADAIVILS